MDKARREQEILLPGITATSQSYELRGKKMKGLLKKFSEAAIFVGTLFAIYIWLGFLIVTLCSYAK